MDIYVNGEIKQIADTCSASQLLDELGLTGQRLAMEVNEEIIPKSLHQTYTFNSGDKVEIVNAIGGG